MNTARALMPDPAELPTVGERIDVFDGMSTIAGGWGTRLSWVRTRAADSRRVFAASLSDAGVPDAVPKNSELKDDLEPPKEAFEP